MQQIIFHIDVNSAYLSWSALSSLEQGSSVDLREIPAIIGGDIEKRHGIVLAKSVSAKVLWKLHFSSRNKLKNAWDLR